MSNLPWSVVDVAVQRLDEILNTPESPRVILARQLRPTDPPRSISFYPVDLAPDQESMEIDGSGVPEPTLQKYNYRAQTLVKHANEMEGRALSSQDSKFLVAILYRDSELRLRLTAIVESLLGSTERVKRHGVVRQRYLNNELQGNFIYLSTTDLWVETEVVPG